MAADNYNEQRVGPVENQVISRFDPGPGNISLIVSGDVPASESGDTLIVSDSAMRTGSFYIAGMGFRREGEYTETLLRCSKIDVPFEVDGEVIYVGFNVDRRNLYTGRDNTWVYVWTNNPPLIPGNGSLFVGNITSGSVQPYIPGDGFDYNCSVAGADSSALFLAYEHPTYRTTDRYNPILGDAMNDAAEEARRLVQTKDGAIKPYVWDNHRSFGIGATYAGQISIDSSTDSKHIRTLSFVSGFVNHTTETSGSVGLQLLDLSHISYKAISASVYVDRYDVSTPVSGTSKNLAPIETVWKDLQKGNTDEPEMIFFTGRARLKTGSVDWQIEEIGNRVTVPTTGSILFKVEGTNTVRYTNATLFAPFLNTVYRTDEYGSVTELWNDTLEGV